MRKHKFWRVLTRIHKWTALVIGTQIILWFASGFFMSFFNIDTVHGDNMALEHHWPLRIEGLVSAPVVLTAYGAQSKINNMRLRSAMGFPIWQVEGELGTRVYNGVTGEKWQGVSSEQVRRAARQYYLGKGQIISAAKLHSAPKDFAGDLPVWQVLYNDGAKTRLYISPDTGELLKTRTRLWRAFDFMWMLHIMDYKTRENINLWWLKLLSFCALLFSLSGLGLVVHRVFLRPRSKK